MPRQISIRSNFLKARKPRRIVYFESVMQAVDSAPNGKWIVASEEQVQNFLAEFRQRVFEKAVQQRIDAL